jgi:putative SOS response-associated peptidase YedK
MCGRFTLKSPGRAKFAQMYSSHLPPLLPRYNIAPSQNVLAIIQGDDQAEASLLQWGLIPSWSKEPKGFINARAETLEEETEFRGVVPPTKVFDSRRWIL